MITSLFGWSLLAAIPARADEITGWKQHAILRGDGEGGWTAQSAEFQFRHKKGGKFVLPFGIIQMSNGEVLLLASWHDGQLEKPVIAFSKDRGDTWTEFALISTGPPPTETGAGDLHALSGRPMMLTDLGKGRLTFQSDKRYFSSDFGHTWNESVPRQPSDTGLNWGVEGNASVDHNSSGAAMRVAEIGWYYEAGKQHPIGDATGAIRWSDDGCKTWKDEVRPPQWKFTVEYNGNKQIRGVSEGSLVRAHNGWLVAALRTDMPPRYFGQPNDDSLEGTAVSISKDDGRTWSGLNMIYDAGRHHAHLLAMPDGRLVMTVIVRDDVRQGKLASYRRGCDAIVSPDNGLTWNREGRFILDEFEFFDGEKWFNGETGHLCSTVLNDGSILTVYGKYLSKGVNLIRWKP
jgi:hypothetical protein